MSGRQSQQTIATAYYNNPHLHLRLLLPAAICCSISLHMRPAQQNALPSEKLVADSSGSAVSTISSTTNIWCTLIPDDALFNMLC
jgi:hypothetical protein